MVINVETYKLFEYIKYQTVSRDTVHYNCHKEHEKDHKGYNLIYKLAGTSDDNDDRVHSS